MKFSTIKTDRTGEHLRQWEFAKFIERIQRDANNNLIGMFRDYSRPDEPESFRHYGEIPRVFAAVELCRQKNGAMRVAAVNSIVVLEVRKLMSESLCRDVKQAAMTLPSTLAAFVGAAGTEVVILVKVARPDGSVPAEEAAAEAFYEQAYNMAVRIYDSVLPARISRMTPLLRHSFLLPLDKEPLSKADAVPLSIDEASALGQPAKGNEQLVDEHPLAQPEQRSSGEVDLTAYCNYERSYNEVLPQVVASLKQKNLQDADYYPTFVTGMAMLLFEKGWPEEETVCHLWRHLSYKNVPGLTEHFVRTLVESTYTQELALNGRLPKTAVKEPIMQQLIRRMESRYLFRHNTLMGYTEYRPNSTWLMSWRPVTEKELNTFTTDLQLSGLNVWNRDVRRYVNSTRVRDYNPVMDYLLSVKGRWDGRDRISELAATVPTDTPDLWAKWFHTWFLAMVNQWQGYNRRFGNSVVPLLISSQGMHKSTFCRRLLPPELVKWGYIDNLSLAEERPVHLAMAQMLLINLDEFNRISPAKQQGFLKNILQLPSVKVKRPYASHTEDVPRLASFIATTNMADVLTDPSGSRRFIGVQVTGSIDISNMPDYAQLYAQAQAEISAGAKCWFDDEETQEIIQHNRRFQQQTTAEMFFLQFFDIPEPTDTDGQWMTATAILVFLKKRAGAAFAVPKANSFGRTMRGLPNIRWRHVMCGTEFFVRLKT